MWMLTLHCGCVCALSVASVSIRLVDRCSSRPCDCGHFILMQVLVKGEPNISYICSRYYRAPELIFGATDYTAAIDIWSVGCVLAELMLGQPMFPGTVTECLPLLGLLLGCNARC